MDLRRRSWVKSATWRIIGVVVLAHISYAITRDWGQTTGITLIFHGLRLILYYCHERLWERIAWGRLKHPLSHLPVRGDLTENDHRIIERFLQERQYLARPPEYQI